MKVLNGGNIVDLPVSEIEVEERLRKVSEDNVANLILMAEDTGITTPIHVRKVRGRHTLIDGGHRLEVAKRLGLEVIAALVVECRADEARAMEASNNLGSARMTPLHTAVFVAAWKKDYYARHPERKPGAFKGNQHTGNLVGVNLTLTKTIADSFGVSESKIWRALRGGEGLSSEEVSDLEGAPNRIAMEDLEALAKVTDVGERRFVVNALANGTTKKVAEARRSWAAGRDEKPAPKDPVEDALQKLKTAWRRAPMAARRRFVSAVAGDLDDMLREGDDA